MKKRILLVSSGRLDRSGVPSVIMTIVRALHQECAFDIMLSSPDEGELEQEFLGFGGRIIRYRKKQFRLSVLNRAADFFRPISLYFITGKVLRANGPYDCVHCHNEFDMAGSLAAAAKVKVPVRIGHVHKTWNEHCGSVSRLYRKLCRKSINHYTTARLGCSHQANDAFYGKDVSAQVLYNPYDNHRFYFRNRPLQEENTIRIAQVGYFCDNKNQLFTLEVFRHLLSAYPDATLTFAGFTEGKYGTAVREKIRTFGLEDRVNLLPPDADIPAVLDKCNLFLLPSHAEGFGIVLIEAQAMGLSCYASDTVPRETDVGGVSFLNLSAGPKDWAQAILRERRFLQKKPYNCSAFSADTFVQSIRELYGRACV